MVKEIIVFGDVETEKRKFHYHENIILLEDVDIDNIQESSMVSSGEKIINTLFAICIIIMNINHYTWCFEKWENMKKVMMVKLNGCSFLIKDDELLKKYNDISNKVSNTMKKEPDVDPICNKQFL